MESKTIIGLKKGGYCGTQPPLSSAKGRIDIVETLKALLEEYKNDSRKVTISGLANQGTEELEIGDIVVAYGEDLVYGIVFEKIRDMYNVIYLTTELVLGSGGLKMEIDHLVKSVRVTPINFYITSDWKAFYEFEIERIEALYEHFISEIIDEQE